MDFAVSTAAFRRTPIHETIQLAVTHDLKIEFSSGMPFQEGMEEVYLAAPCKKLLHNYFPAPKVPFVLNLASLSTEISERSIEHCLRCLNLTARSGADFYAVHAGFCLDPTPNSLGRKIHAKPEHPREKYWTQFLKNIQLLTQEAERLNVRLLVENNVLAPFNVQEDGSNPFLCTDPKGIGELLSAVESPNLGLLVDTGHLKVSAHTLGFGVDELLSMAKKRIHAFHHSDNNGMEDTNQPIGPDYWFLNHASKFRGATHILEILDQSIEQIKTQFQLIRTAADRT